MEDLAISKEEIVIGAELDNVATETTGIAVFQDVNSRKINKMQFVENFQLLIQNQLNFVYWKCL